MNELIARAKKSEAERERFVQNIVFKKVVTNVNKSTQYTLKCASMAFNNPKDADKACK
ncbi:MAG: hypothetical protein LKK00_09365 [Intestinimonas sp.]|jgi:hypothetical protein|nr:hypothetical protein [Intestinimonas sp.]